MSDNRSYLNSELMDIEVTHEHLDKAVELKIEIQNASPARKCNWKLHKKLMKESGFNDSDYNEAYRCLVKDYQSKVGLLPTLDRHVDLLADNKISAIGKLVGEIYEEKRENQIVLTKLNKFKRELVLDKLIAEEIRDVFLDDVVFNIPHYVYAPELKSSRNRAIVTLTDLHIGSLINNCMGNSFNLEIASKRLKSYLNKVIDHCKTYDIKEVDVVGLGDFVEHTYMRYKQNEETELKLSQQILHATRLIIEFIVGLSEYVNVSYEAIAGNHDRLQGDKDISYDDDNVSVIINSNIKTFIELTNSKRIKFIETEDGATEINKVINGKRIKLVHGHLDEGDKKDRLKSYISMLNEFTDVLIYGHLHNFKVEDSDNGRMTIGIGCLSGKNSYSKKLKCATNASQAMIVVTENGDIYPLRIDLQIN